MNSHKLSQIKKTNIRFFKYTVLVQLPNYYIDKINLKC